MYDIRVNSCNSSEYVKLVYENNDGILDINKIFIENGIDSDYFISSPPGMIKTFKQVLISKGVPENHVLTDDWE
jgi:NAD(P)H-flavin reductase